MTIDRHTYSGPAPRPTLTAATLLLASSLTVMAGAVIAPALPAMHAHFAEVPNSGTWVRLVLTISALPIVVGAPLAGLIGDRGGRTRLLLASIALYVIAGSSGLYLDSLGAILVGRVLLGVAMAGLMTSTTALIGDYYSGAERARFMGWQAAAMNLGGIVFLTGGGTLAELGWRLPFAIYLLPFPLIFLARYALPEPATGATTAHSSEPSRDSGLIRAVESDHEGEPVATLAPIYTLALIGMIAFYMIPSQLPFHLETLLGTGPTASGTAIALATFAGMITSLSYGRIRARLGFSEILMVNLILMAAGHLIIWRAESFALLLVGLALGGLGMGLLMPNFNLWVTTTSPAASRGRALGGLATAIFLGQFLSPLVSQAVASVIGLRATFGAAAAALFLLTAALWLTPLPRGVSRRAAQRSRARPHRDERVSQQGAVSHHHSP